MLFSGVRVDTPSDAGAPSSMLETQAIKRLLLLAWILEVTRDRVLFKIVRAFMAFQD